MNTEAKRLDSEFVVMGPGFGASPVLFTPEMFQQLDEKFDAFRGHLLVSAFTFEEDWSSWEIHPHGDEIVILLSGDITLVMRSGRAETRMRLREPGAYVIVPRGTWHTGRTSTPTKMLFCTPGEGTINAEKPYALKSVDS